VGGLWLTILWCSSWDKCVIVAPPDGVPGPPCAPCIAKELYVYPPIYPVDMLFLTWFIWYPVNGWYSMFFLVFGLASEKLSRQNLKLDTPTFELFYTDAIALPTAICWPLPTTALLEALAPDAENSSVFRELLSIEAFLIVLVLFTVPNRFFP